MKRRRGEISPRKALVIAGSVLLWAGALLALIIVFFLGDENKAEPVFGSLEGRFESSITMNLGGKTLRYRENEITNYLIIGVDKEDVTQVSGHQHGGQADFLILLAIDRVRRTVTPVMLDRDTMAPMQTYGIFGHPSGTRVMQLCLAQAYSGVNIPGSINTVETVEKLLHGIVISHYLVVDMTAIPLANDSIGGVEVTLSEDFTVYDPAMTKGATLRLMGDQAEYFVRGRMAIGDGSNAARMARQQQYLSAFLNQFRQAVKKDPGMLNQLLDAMQGHMATDASDHVLLHDANAYDDYEWKPLQTPDGRHAVDEYGFAEFWIDDDALKALVADIWFN